MSEYDTEVVIAGAGLTGCTFAALLCRAGVSCTVVDAGKGGSMRGGESPDPRALAITPASARIFAAIRVWQQLPPDRIGFFTGMHVWDAGSVGEIRFDCADTGEPVLAWIVEQAVLQAGLNAAMDYLPGLRLVRGHPLASFARAEDGVVLELGNGDRIRAGLLVAADGSQSPARELAGIGFTRHAYRQRAVACVVNTAGHHRHVARQRFLETGPLAFLPMAGGHTGGIVWSTTPEQAAMLLEMPAAEFGNELAWAFESRLGEIRDIGPRAGFDLYRGGADTYIADRVALIGDAAHGVHPLAGQGANMGLLDAAVLAEAIIAAKARRRQPGSRPVLRRYERWRRGENERMSMALDALKRVFDHTQPLLAGARGAGMTALDRLPFIKHRVVRYAMGLEGELPEVVRRTRVAELT